MNILRVSDSMATVVLPTRQCTPDVYNNRKELDVLDVDGLRHLKKTIAIIGIKTKDSCMHLGGELHTPNKYNIKENECRHSN